ncbi:MAG: FAD-binding protein [Alphaproteobacteria bacterium]|nr:FAD-binding protein [Alphaproteobacteria bacterium]
MIPIGDSALAQRLRRELRGEVLFDAFSRGRYSTDASIYQIEPVGVVVPRDEQDIAVAMQVAREAGCPVLPRGAGTSQCGQTVGRALVVDVSKHLNKVVELDAAARRVTVEPGVVLDHLNAYLRPHNLFFPVDVSPSSRATIGGMTGNNSCGSRSIRYGNMVHNVLAIEALLADGERARFGVIGDNRASGARLEDISRKLRALGLAEAEEIERRFPKLLRRVGGYNIDQLTGEQPNLAKLLVGSEGTLAFSTRIELELQPVPKHRTLGICHFPRFYAAMEATQHIVKLGPSAVELVDRTMIGLARDIPMFKATVDKFVVGAPDALLLVEFAGDDQADVLRRLKDLVALIGDLGFPGAVVEATDPAFQRAVWDVRAQGLNIMMSMKGEGKPVSFIEDCAVPLEDLAEYTDRLTKIFHKHGTDGTWYAHASVGTLHVRPVLNLKLEKDAKAMRAIAAECFAMVREYKGSHSGEHGDGLVRSEFHEPMFGRRIVKAFEQVKDTFDPGNVMNPGKIVRPSKMDDRGLFRYAPGYATQAIDTAFDWSAWGGFGGAVEMCNNNGACRRTDAGVMCPSFRATRDERDLTRGRANSLRLALSGQFGPDALVSADMKATMDLCVGCKGCKRECPTGVDMARMKLEFLAQYRRRHKPDLRDWLIANLPVYAPIAAMVAPLMNLRDTLPGLAAVSEKVAGFSARRALPRWRRDALKDGEGRADPARADVLLFADCFNRWFEPQIPRAALRVLDRAGKKAAVAGAHGHWPLCCGRTYLSVGLVDQAREQARRTIAALKPAVERGAAIVGLEPSCLLTLRDEYPALLPGKDTDTLASRAMLFEEYLAAERKAGRLDLAMKPLAQKRALLHGHCHQKAFGLVGGVADTLAMVPELKVETIESSCCGMAGSFGYEAEHHDLSLAMAELSLLPALRKADADALVVADGTSCRHQIKDGAGRQALHVAEVLDRALA